MRRNQFSLFHLNFFYNNSTSSNKFSSNFLSVNFVKKSGLQSLQISFKQLEKIMTAWDHFESGYSLSSFLLVYYLKYCLWRIFSKWSAIHLTLNNILNELRKLTCCWAVKKKSSTIVFSEYWKLLLICNIQETIIVEWRIIGPIKIIVFVCQSNK